MSRNWIIMLGIAVSACSGSASQDEAPEPTALVSLAPARQEALGATLTLYGAAEPGPMGKLSLSAPAEATVVAIEALPGTSVTRGQVVARLTPSPTTKVDLAKAASDAKLVEAAYARAQRLRSDGLVSDADVETARSAATSASALYASLSKRTTELTLRATSAGVVDSVLPVIGDLVQPGAVIASVSRSGDVRAHFGVDPSAVHQLHVGQQLKIAGNTGNNGRAPISAIIDSINPMVDQTTKLASVFVHVPGTSGISIGETLTADVALGALAQTTVTVPYAALLDDGGQPYVYVASGGVAHRHDATLGAIAGDRVAIRKGVRPGEQVVVSGGTALEDGMKVRTK